MLKSNKAISHFTINDLNDDSEKRLAIFDAIKNNTGISIEDLAAKPGVSSELLTYSLPVYQKKKLVEINDAGGRKTVSLKGSERCFLGAGFDNENCYMALVDASGKIIKREKIFLPTLKGIKGRIREFKEIIKELARGTRLRGSSLYMAGMAVPDELEKKSEKAVPMLAEGISRLFGCKVIVAKGATAAAYGEREYNDELRGKDILYLHTDSGDGVVVKKEVVSEKKTVGEGPEAYLRPWNQFDAVRTSKDLVNKGLGTDIVTMVNGDIDAITIADVLDAAENKDELAEDLVKRSALALGVRSAYLINIFDVENVVLGGGIDKKEGSFAEYVKESQRRFLLSEKAGKIRIIHGVLGNESYSIGAALLCRRELFTEV